MTAVKGQLALRLTVRSFGLARYAKKEVELDFLGGLSKIATLKCSRQIRKFFDRNIHPRWVFWKFSMIFLEASPRG